MMLLMMILITMLIASMMIDDVDDEKYKNGQLDINQRRLTATKAKVPTPYY